MRVIFQSPAASYRLAKSSGVSYWSLEWLMAARTLRGGKVFSSRFSSFRMSLMTRLESSVS